MASPFPRSYDSAWSRRFQVPAGGSSGSRGAPLLRYRSCALPRGQERTPRPRLRARARRAGTVSGARSRASSYSAEGKGGMGNTSSPRTALVYPDPRFARAIRRCAPSRCEGGRRRAPLSSPGRVERQAGGQSRPPSRCVGLGVWDTHVTTYASVYESSRGSPPSG